MSTLVFPSMTTPAPPKAPDVQDFVSSGTWVMPAGARLVLAELIGGGGGWGNNFGGSGGGYARMLFTPDSLALNESVSVGAGGSAGTSSTSGGAGGDTTFGGLVGQGGKAAPTSSIAGAPGGVTLLPGLTANMANMSGQFAGGSGSNASSTSLAMTSSSDFGGGGGSVSSLTGVVSKGGMLSGTFGTLKGGDGGTNTRAAEAPGGAGGSYATNRAGARGQARITTFF